MRTMMRSPSETQFFLFTCKVGQKNFSDCEARSSKSRWNESKSLYNYFLINSPFIHLAHQLLWIPQNNYLKGKYQISECFDQQSWLSLPYRPENIQEEKTSWQMVEQGWNQALGSGWQWCYRVIGTQLVRYQPVAVGWGWGFVELIKKLPIPRADSTASLGVCRSAVAIAPLWRRVRSDRSSSRLYIMASAGAVRYLSLRGPGTLIVGPTSQTRINYKV